jgi:hypothetical protein
MDIILTILLKMHFKTVDKNMQNEMYCIFKYRL